MAGSFVGAVWAFRAAALASNASVHSTRMLPKFLMIFLWLYSQLISAQSQWIAALNEVNTARFGICGKKNNRSFTTYWTYIQFIFRSNTAHCGCECRGVRPRSRAS